jgi:phosphoribosylaminoimidazolecarboxamide formyltransferase/IMP cyclohydrolase
LAVALEKFLDLSYGENPHQRAALYTEVGARSHVLSKVAKLHGRALSFNNVLDLDAARDLLSEFEQPACVIVKHNNPCGVALAETLDEAHRKALACDPLSAFGGVVALNREVGPGLAERLHETFIEVLIAPGYAAGVLDVLRRKEAIRIMEDAEQRAYETAERDVKRVRGGLLIQDADRAADSRESMQVVTRAEPNEAQWADLLFAWQVARHVRSNAIVVANDLATVGIGAGQMSRVDSVRIALHKAGAARGDEAEAVLAGSAVASDAFFPFADGPQAAIDAGARAFIQPGGSVRDEEVIAACDAADVSMVLTGRRHFRH